MPKDNQYLVAYAGEYVRITAPDEKTALALAKADYNGDRKGDWKDSEHTDRKWDVIQLN